MNTILVVEDEFHLRNAILKYLELEGVAADGAATLQEARQLLAVGAYRIVVLDLNLPDGDGLRLAAEIPKQIELIIVSARGALDQRLEGLRAGAYAYLVKPLYLPELVAIIENIQGRIAEAQADKPESVLQEIAVSWTGEPADAAPHCISGCCTGTLLDIPPAVSGATGSLLLQPVGHDICLCRIECNATAPETDSVRQIASIDITWSEPVLVFTAVQSGSVTLSEQTIEKGISLEAGMIRCRREFAPTYLVGSDGPSGTLQTLCISMSLLNTIMGSENTEALMVELGLGGEAPSALHPVSPMTSALFHACLPEGLECDQQTVLRVQSQILSFLNALIEGLKFQNRPARQETYAEKIEQLHEELLNPEMETVKLEELAKRFNCSSKTLNDGFKKAYGQSISNFQLSQRMIAAHEALLATNQPIKSIGVRYGYTYVNHFITAFRKYFGYTPGTLRE